MNGEQSVDRSRGVHRGEPGDDPMLGRTISHYEIVEKVGEGGMGEVYRATDTLLHRQVALKVLPTDKGADATSRRRFLREARSASALNHPNIITIHDVVSEGDLDCIVMELVEGTPLDRLIPEDGMPVDRALDCARQIAEAVAVAHAAGIVHRDLKPGNVMITPDDRVKVLDFGLAKRDSVIDHEAPTAELTAALTQLGAVVGTLHYMSPEQAQGEVADARSDVFSLGAVLFEMLSGSRPFQGKSAVALMHAVAYDEPRRLRDLRPEVAPAVESIARKAMAKDPADRFQSMTELLAALKAAALDPSAPLQATPPDGDPSGVVPARAAQSAAPGSPPRSRRTRLQLAVAGGLLLALAAFLSIPRLTGLLGDSRDQPVGATQELAEEDLEALDPYALYQRGSELLERYDKDGHIEQAIDSFRRAIRKDDAHAAAYSGLAGALWRKARATKDRTFLEQAENAALHALELEPELTEAAVNLALVKIERGDPAEARGVLDPLVALDPGNAQIYRALGSAAEAEGRPEDAEPLYRKAIDIEPQERELHGVLGSFFFRRGRYGEAVDAYRRWVELAPDDFLGRKNLAAALHMTGDYAGAAGELQEALKIRPDWQIYSNLGTLYFFQGLYEQSARAFEKAVELGAQDYRIWANLGDAYRWTPGREEAAADALLRAIQLLRKRLAEDPGNVTLQSRLALFLAKRGDWTEALREARSTKAEKDPGALYRLATVYELVGQRDRAIEQLEAALLGGYSMSEFERDPEMEGLRGDPRVQLLLTRFDAGGRGS